MTKADYDRITETRTSVPSEDRAAPPTPVHKFQRGQHRIRHRGPRREGGARGRAAHHLRAEGDVWIVSGEDYDRLKRDGVIREWTDAERARIPETIGLGDGVSHGDMRGTTIDRTVKVDFKF